MEIVVINVLGEPSVLKEHLYIQEYKQMATCLREKGFLKDLATLNINA